MIKERILLTSLDFSKLLHCKQIINIPLDLISVVFFLELLRTTM